ncbi:uncharacterized protein MYCFIDRAFT_177726 [Pseudocercospora fijiensis CIRAD86]|uniref:Uncharacterized protein n=1 Tax=Pseudocercospora fijiensis (strain CIRAD86) TaxID=383855 RepID=M2YMT6_PSEFD|nr:uncharacterized protein MYCFIDRAFT_177726 [Pseudocercospora fijiensis CIRAD86]EME79055.1 hypothetical protein MYCFIDRAFT_177726 [Pseudocercospora fijiensis CIRAD86]
MKLSRDCLLKTSPDHLSPPSQSSSQPAGYLLSEPADTTIALRKKKDLQKHESKLSHEVTTLTKSDTSDRLHVVSSNSANTWISHEFGTYRSPCAEDRSILSSTSPLSRNAPDEGWERVDNVLELAETTVARHFNDPERNETRDFVRGIHVLGHSAGVLHRYELKTGDSWLPRVWMALL